MERRFDDVKPVSTGQWASAHLHVRGGGGPDFAMEAQVPGPSGQLEVRYFDSVHAFLQGRGSDRPNHAVFYCQTANSDGSPDWLEGVVLMRYSPASRGSYNSCRFRAEKSSTLPNASWNVTIQWEEDPQEHVGFLQGIVRQ